MIRKLTGKKLYMWEVYKSSDGYRFRFKAPNGEIMLQSEGYSSKQKAKEGIKAIKKAIPISRIVEI